MDGNNNVKNNVFSVNVQYILAEVKIDWKCSFFDQIYFTNEISKKVIGIKTGKVFLCGNIVLKSILAKIYNY